MSVSGWNRRAGVGQMANVLLCLACVSLYMQEALGWCTGAPFPQVRAGNTSILRCRKGGVTALKAGLFDGLFGQQGQQSVPSSTAVDVPVKITVPQGDWEELMDEASGSAYYWNKASGETSWDRPPALGGAAAPAPAPAAVSVAAGGVPEAASSATRSGGVMPGGEMPKLYDGWFSTVHEFLSSNGETTRRIEGVGEIAGEMTAAVNADDLSRVNAAMADGIMKMEVTFPPVPNLEEVDFGTAINQRFSNEIREYMGLEGKSFGSEVRRNLVDFANHYWACRLAESCGTEKSVYVMHCDQTSKKSARSVGQNVWVGRPKALPKPVLEEGDMCVCVNPGVKEQWEETAKKASARTPFVFLNSISGGWTYELGGPMKDYEQVFYLKRISKGYVFRKYPGPWKALCETPEGDTVVVKSYDKRPLLRDVSAEVRQYSFNNFGIMNDRYAKGFGGRL